MPSQRKARMFLAAYSARLARSEERKRGKQPAAKPRISNKINARVAREYGRRVECRNFCRRRRRSSSEDEGPISGWKMGLVIGVVVLCFGMLYPSLFHPMISSFFSKSPPPQQTVPNRPPIHPSMSSPRARPDIHPGTRMAAAQAEAQTTSSSKGMFAWMLPLYTVGVKTSQFFLKSKKKKRRRRYAYSSEESDSYEDDDEYGQRGGALHNLGSLTICCSHFPSHHSSIERLKQTELAMSKILEQLGTISTEATQGTMPYTPQNSVENGAAESSKNPDSDSKTADITNVDKEQYLRDLEKALREFKHLSNSYNKEQRRRRGESVSEEEDMDEDEQEEEVEEDEGIEERTHDDEGSAESVSEEESQQKNDSENGKNGGHSEDKEKKEEEETTMAMEQHVQRVKPHKRSKRT
ncbi:unnamed protein product [Toxocara canis]|uniref:RIC3 domain-containing protein n=1 Tax=Toxocara canis TaxID=6265 RepID=A0A183V3X6_TOXCA|nr:unnamed protein product [Toxocara canis]